MARQFFGRNLEQWQELGLANDKCLKRLFETK